LDIFEEIANTSEPMKKLVTRERVVDFQMLLSESQKNQVSSSMVGIT
jgi:hypothetical protein